MCKKAKEMTPQNKALRKISVLQSLTKIFSKTIHQSNALKRFRSISIKKSYSIGFSAKENP